MRLSHSYSALKLYENCPYRYFRQRISKDIVDAGGEASKHGERVHEYLEHRLKSNTALPQEIAPYETLCSSVEHIVGVGGELHIEKELVLNENLRPTGWWDVDAWLRSKLDILVINGDVANVMDWKTGKRKTDQFQMELFAAQVFQHYPEVTQVKTSLVWLKTFELDTETYLRAGVDRLWAEVMQRIRRIHVSLEHDNWPAKPSGLCKFCPARHDCDSARL